MIFYFSGTGNTRWASGVLSKKTGEEMVFIPDAIEKGAYSYTLKEKERIGFCFPVHGWRPPKIVRGFIEKLHIENAQDRYCYALCTCGDNIGECTRELQKSLSKAGLHAESVFSLIMPNTYLGLPGFHLDGKPLENEKIRRAEIQIEKISDLILKKAAGEEMTIKGGHPWMKTYFLGGFFAQFLITDRPFKVDPDKCISCGLCFSACPVGNILWTKGGIPSWKRDGSCTSCLSCYHHCPRHAIEYGRNTLKEGQYCYRDNKEQEGSAKKASPEE